MNATLSPKTDSRPRWHSDRPRPWRGCARLVAMLALACAHAWAGAAEATPPSPPEPGANLALVAAASTSFVSGHETIAALNDGASPAHSDDKSHGAYGNWPRRGAQWVQYEWSQPISTCRMDVYWFDDRRGVRLPKSCRLSAWDGAGFVPVTQAKGLGLTENQFNTTTFPEVTTSRLRLEFEGEGESSTGLLEWRVYDSGRSPNFAPTVSAGADRIVVLPGKTYLAGTARDDGKPKPSLQVRWRKASGPGSVRFSNARSLETTARFSAPGEYVLSLTASDGQLRTSAPVRVRAEGPPPSAPLQAVATTTYQVSSPFWRPRLKNLVVNWIPHCIRKIEDPGTREGGLDNFVQAGRKLAGAAAGRHVGHVFADAWTYNTIESMCVAQSLDASDDPEIGVAQAAMRRTLEDWIPKVLGAQEPDGYLHTQYTLEGRPRWSNKDDHEGYQAGYFIEAALAHFRATGGQDRRLIDAARRLADCWVRHIGPAPRKTWYDGHQELEHALVRLARFVDEREGPGQGRPYLELARFLLDSRRGGSEYDQSHLPVTRQYAAAGHAVRALYSYTAMAEVALATGDPDYRSAVRSLCDNLVNRKYYLTGGVGSGETSEGFGKDYSLPNRAYCESCANCGELFFQQELHRGWQDAAYADRAEETLFNAILGGLDLEGRNFTYTNPLDGGERRYPWHACPCCVGNLPRTLLMLPTWMYATAPRGLWVNLFAGSTVTVTNVAGTSVRLVQTTDYPWNGKVTLALDPAVPRTFTLHLRVPNRQTSALYTGEPAVQGLISLALNGAPVPVRLERGYAVISRRWQAGDRLEFEIPLPVQRVRASSQVAADAGRVALRVGPLVYNFESVDQNLDAVLSPASPLATEWQGDLLGGVMVVKGRFADGSPLLAVPNYARLNRGGRSVVWIRGEGNRP